jgi:hypothetical protein
VAVDGQLYTWGWGGSQGSHSVDGRSSGGQLVRVVPSVSRGVHCTKLVRVHVSAQEGY